MTFTARPIAARGFIMETATVVMAKREERPPLLSIY
jgi:hypothetical protein